MRKYHIGGFALTVSFDDGLLDKTPAAGSRALTNQLQRDSEFPLLFAADFERALAYRLTGVTSFPHAMAFGATRDPTMRASTDASRRRRREPSACSGTGFLTPM